MSNWTYSFWLAAFWIYIDWIHFCALWGTEPYVALPMCNLCAVSCPSPSLFSTPSTFNCGLPTPGWEWLCVAPSVETVEDFVYYSASCTHCGPLAHGPLSYPIHESLDLYGYRLMISWGCRVTAFDRLTIHHLQNGAIIFEVEHRRGYSNGMLSRRYRHYVPEWMFSYSTT